MESFSLVHMIIAAVVCTLLGWFAHKFLIGHWTNKELYDILQWILGIDNHKALKEVSFKELMQAYKFEKTLDKKLNKIGNEPTRKDTSSVSRNITNIFPEQEPDDLSAPSE